MANFNQSQAHLRSRCFESKRFLACGQQALIVIPLLIMSLCISTKPITSSHIAHLPQSNLHLNKSANININTNTTTGATTTTAHHLQQVASQTTRTTTTATIRTPTEANDNDYHETVDWVIAANRFLDDPDNHNNNPYLTNLDRLFALSLERVLRMIAEVGEDDKQLHKLRFKRQLNELELIKELNDTTPAPIYREQESVTRETRPTLEPSGTSSPLVAQPETAAMVSLSEPNAALVSPQMSSNYPQRQRSARAKKQAPSNTSTTPQPSYSSPGVTGENPIGPYAMATTPASSVDAPQNIEVQVSNDQQQQQQVNTGGGANESNMMNDLADVLAISTTRPPAPRAEKPLSRKQSLGNGIGDIHHYKLNKVPGPEHNPMKEIRVGGSPSDDSSLDESSNQDQASVNSLAEAIGAELASNNRQPEAGDDVALQDLVAKPNFLGTNLPLRRDKRPVQSRDEQQFQQPADNQQMYQTNQHRQSPYPAAVESMALMGGQPLAPYTFDQNMALIGNGGNLRQPGSERVMNLYSNPLASSDYGFGPTTITTTAATTTNSSRGSSFARQQADNNWSVPVASGSKSSKNIKTRTPMLDMSNGDLGGSSGFITNNNNEDLTMLFHNSKMQNKRAGLALATESLKNNLLLPYQQPFSNRFSLTGSSSKKSQHQQQQQQQQQQLLAGAMGSNMAASAPYRHYLNPLGVVNDQTRSSQEAVYGEGVGGGQFTPAIVSQQGGANQNQVLGLVRVAPAQLNAAVTGTLQQQQQRAAYAPLVRRNSPLAFLSGGGGGASDYLPYPSGATLPASYLAAAAAKYSRSMQQQQQQNPQHRTISAYQHRIGRHEPNPGGAVPNYDDGGGGSGQQAASVTTTSTSDPMWSDTQNHEEDYQQSPQTIQITAVPNGLGLANPNFVNGFNGFNGFGGGWGGWNGPWNGRQVLLVNKQPQQVGTEWRSWLIPVAIILALPLILGALFIPVFLKSVMFLIQILQMLGLLMPPSQLASHLLSNTHGSQSG